MTYFAEEGGKIPEDFQWWFRRSWCRRPSRTSSSGSSSWLSGRRTTLSTPTRCRPGPPSSSLARGWHLGTRRTPRILKWTSFWSTSLVILLALDGFDLHYQASVYFPQTSASDKSQQQQDHEEKSWERRESNPGQLGEKCECYLCAMIPPPSISCQIDRIQTCTSGTRDDRPVHRAQHFLHQLRACQWL